MDLASKLNIKIPRGSGIGLKKYFKNYDRHAIDLLERMLTYNPERRITAEEILRHPYLMENQYDNSMSGSYYKMPSTNYINEKQSTYYNQAESMYLSNGTHLRNKPWDDQPLKTSISIKKFDQFSTNHQDLGPTESLYLPKDKFTSKFEISAHGKIVPSKKFHQSLYDPQENLYQSRHHEKSYYDLKKEFELPIDKRNMLRYSEYRKEEMITPKANTRRTIDLENIPNDKMMKHLSYSHGGKHLRVLEPEDFWEKKKKSHPREYYGRNRKDHLEGGLKMKKMQFEEDMRRDRKVNEYHRRKFDTNNTFASGKNIDIYSANYSPSKDHKKSMSYKRQKTTRGNNVANKIISAYEDEFDFDINSESANQSTEKFYPQNQNSIKQMLMSKNQNLISPDHRKKGRIYHNSTRNSGFHAETGGSYQVGKKPNYRRGDLREKRSRKIKDNMNPVSIDKKNKLSMHHYKVQSFIKNRNLKPTLKDLKQRYTDNEIGDYSVNTSPISNHARWVLK